VSRVSAGRFAAALVFTWASALPLAAQVGRVEVAEVRFEGNHSFPSDSLARAIITRETECKPFPVAIFCWAGADFATQRYFLPRSEIPRDQLRIRIWYRTRGFRETQVDTATAVGQDGRVRVTFAIDEGRPVLVDTIIFGGADELESRDLLEDLPLRVGRPLSTIAADATRDTLMRRLANRGYARVDVLRGWFIPADDPYRAEVTFDIAPGPRSRYGDIAIEGNRSLSESTVLRTLQFRSGELYRIDQLQEAQARLFGMDIIRSAVLERDFESGPDSVIPIRVRVQEGEPHRVRAGAGWSTSECLDVDARWVSRNYFGGGRRLQLRARVSNILAQGFHELLCPQSGSGDYGDLNWIASVDFVQPWIFSTRNSFQASVFYERQSLPDIFVRKAVGVTTALTRALGPRTPLTLSYRPELSRLDGAAEVLFCTTLLVCREADIDALQGAQWIAPVGLSVTRSTVNSVINPSRGFSAVVDLEHAAGWTGSNFPYNRVVVEAARYESLGGGGVLAARLRGGWVSAGAFPGLPAREESTDIVHPQRRFYAGGANSVRGFAQGRLGPRVLTADIQGMIDLENCSPESILDKVCDATALGDAGFDPRPTGGTRVLEGNIEFRFPVASRVQAATFTDVGQVWDVDETVSIRDLEVTPGVGIRYLSPIGPVRVDLAYRFRGGEFLSVITELPREFDPAIDDELDRLTEKLPDDTRVPIPWVRSDALVTLDPVFFDDSPALSLRRFQLHISIGQAF
jgi:outer membrane protein insertion porin family/translocation and assembly module TamA